MITQISHLGIAVRSLDNQIPFYRDILNLEFHGIEDVPDQQVRVAMFKIGEIRIELLEPTSDESPITKFLKQKGEGMHHIAYETDDIEKEIDKLKKSNVQLIDEIPRPGAKNTSIVFIHPHSSGKVLTEICQHK